MLVVVGTLAPLGEKKKSKNKIGAQLVDSVIKEGRGYRGWEGPALMHWAFVPFQIVPCLFTACSAEILYVPL